MKCLFCSYENEQGANFCKNCGKKIVHKEEQVRVCISCGAEIRNKSKFCSECGTPQEYDKSDSLEESYEKEKTFEQSNHIDNNISYEMPLAAKEERGNTGDNGNIGKNKSKKSIKDFILRNLKEVITLGVAAIVIVVAIIEIAFSFITPTINLNKYVNIQIIGYDSAESITVSIDKEKLTEDYGDKIYKTIKNKEKSVRNPEDAINFFIRECVSYSHNTDGGLNNGDMITVEWECNDKLAESKFGHKLKYSTIEKKIENLEQMSTFDPFEGYEVKYSGVSPWGVVARNQEAREIDGVEIKYEINKKDGLSNGDVILVKVCSPDENETISEYYYNRCGKIPYPTQMEYKVNGIDRYLTSVDDISEKGKKELYEFAESQYYNSETLEFDISEEKVEKIEPLGLMIFSKINASEKYEQNSTYNDIYIVLQISIRNEYSNARGNYNQVNNVYWYKRVKNVVIDTNGDIVIYSKDNNSKISHYVNINSGVYDPKKSVKHRWTYHGYDDLEHLKNDIAKSKKSFILNTDLGDTGD
ncbi:MAG: zinc ribbon domain-containing protein [Agathobacter sp.]|nr:zinc ribbon domain-containing protein [Agathobacter sp.]